MKDDIFNEIPEIKLENCNILFLDPSSSCTGYAVAEVNFSQRKAKILKTGAIWFDKYWNNQDKYHYIFRAITIYFNIISQIDFCIAEAYIINMNKRSGCQVSPELHGAIQTALAEIDVKYLTITPQTWRSQLGIKSEPVVDEEGNTKKTKTGKTVKDFKVPTRNKIKEYIDLPEKIVSNITKSERKTPDDVTDALGVCLGSLTKLGIKNFDFSETQVQEDTTQVFD